MVEQRGRRYFGLWMQVGLSLALGMGALSCGDGNSQEDSPDSSTTRDAGTLFDASAEESDGNVEESCGNDEDCISKGAELVCIQGECLRCGPTAGIANYVYDGDTFYLDDGRRIRLLLVNAPEVANPHTGKEADCYGNESRDFVRSLLASGKEIHLAYDVSCLDRFDRLLAWVTVDGMDLNGELLRRGLARVLHVPPNGGSRLSEYRALERAAQEEGAGMWSACGNLEN